MFSRVQPCYQKQVINQAGKGFSAGRKWSEVPLCLWGAPALQAGGHRFESGYLHQFFQQLTGISCSRQNPIVVNFVAGVVGQRSLVAYFGLVAWPVTETKAISRVLKRWLKAGRQGL